MTHRKTTLFFAIFFALTFLSNAAHAQLSGSVGLLKGEVTLADGTPLANIPVVIFRETERVNTTRSNPQGKLTAILQPNATYRVVINMRGYMYHEDTLRVPALHAYRVFPLHIVLSPLRDGQMFGLPLPVFEPRSSKITPAAFPELDRITNEIQHTPKVSVSVVVYPDAVIKSKWDRKQKALVAAREASMRSYFLGKGISDSRFTVESVTTVLPAGRFPMPANMIPHRRTRSRWRGRRWKKTKSPTKPMLFPQYVEIMAHVFTP